MENGVIECLKSKMIYKDKHFFTLQEHLYYLKNIEKLDDININQILREYWHCKNVDILSIWEHYELKEE